MPGMMATLLNVGLNQETVRGLIRMSGDPRLAWDCYRRFVQGYGEVIGGLDLRAFDERLKDFIAGEEVPNEAELDPEALERLTSAFLSLAEERLGSAIPSDPIRQLEAAVRAVYRSWESPKACEYRRLNKLDDLIGTAVTVQTMVFGNAGGSSGSGVAFTRNPATGAKGLYADFVTEGQGEDVVSGRRIPEDFAKLKERMPRVAEELAAGAELLECEFKDMQDIEFTVEEGQLYFLQTRSGKRTPRAALLILIDLLKGEIVDEREARSRAEGLDLEATAVTRFGDDAEAIARGNGASPGVACGRVVFDSARAAELTKSRDPIILVRPETSTEDIAGFALAAGILTAVGGRTAHAAVVARQLGKVCVVGCAELIVDGERGGARLGDQELCEGDWISIDGDTGEVFLGKREIVADHLTAQINELNQLLKRSTVKKHRAKRNASS
jgi:pyruvate,orthophosphate dikinase